MGSNYECENETNMLMIDDYYECAYMMRVDRYGIDLWAEQYGKLNLSKKTTTA